MSNLLQRVLEGKDFLLFDGGMGTMLQRNGLGAGELPELLCLTNPEAVTSIHRAYVEAGSQVVSANTFGANRLKLKDAASVEEIYHAGIFCARASGASFVAADIGPIGTLLQPLGTLPFNQAYDLFKEQVCAAANAKADLIIIETMSDLLEIKAAVLAAKECCDLPIFASMTFGEDGRTFLGTTPAIAARTLDALGVDALGINCSLGPSDLAPLVHQMLEVTRRPVIVQANAGLPSVVNGTTVYSIDAVTYAAKVEPMVAAGASIIGGCCGTDPDYIRELFSLIKGRRPTARTIKPVCAVTSAQHEVVLRGKEVAVIGECINPTGRKRLKDALRSQDYNFIVGMAIAQENAGADILDINAGLPELDEIQVLCELVKQIQSVCSLPLQIDSSDPAAVEAAVRIYAGKPLINSVNGKQETLDALLPIAAHYGCAIVGLTLDTNGIPKTAEERLAIAERIVKAAEHAGIPREDILIDCLVMSASTNQNEVCEILRAITLCKESLGVRTMLGASNISFGLPARPLLNATFLAAAFAAGLNMPITNPLDVRLRTVIDSWRVLCGQDTRAVHWVKSYGNWQDNPCSADGELTSQTVSSTGVSISISEHSEQELNQSAASVPSFEALRNLVMLGLKGDVPQMVEQLLVENGSMEIVNNVLIPALNEVGDRFEAGVLFLPQLMAASEAAKAGFDIIRVHAGDSSEVIGKQSPIVLATVKGDIHDIGKNIVRMLLENYGYQVIDLGYDVAPQAIVDAVLIHQASLVGLSALMTTTVHAMRDTIALLREQTKGVTVMVGGAVLTPEYAKMVGADFYAKDAAETVRIAANVIE